MPAELFLFFLFCLAIMIYGLWKLYEFLYYRSENFLCIKDNIKEYTKECNELNKHIESLKNTPLSSKQTDYGSSIYSDTSIYNYKRPEYSKISKKSYVYNCSLTVFKNARLQPFKYICKYFNMKESEEVLSAWENVLNNYSAVENGKTVLLRKKKDIMTSIEDEIPFLIRKISWKLENKLGFDAVDLEDIYFPKYIFNYVSSGGYASGKCEILLDIVNLNKFVEYLSDVVKFKKSVYGQRALMNSKLRDSILQRDNFTCKKCGISTKDEKHLLLEVDHIIPISKGGITSVENLQTLCWKCNRTKGNKIE